jgi:hypothetical protein
MYDPLGEVTLEPNYSDSIPEFVPLDPSDPNYDINIDDETEDIDTPASKARKRLRKRLRFIRAKMSVMDPMDLATALQKYKDDQVQLATAELLAYWIAQQLGFAPL